MKHCLNASGIHTKRRLELIVTINSILLAWMSFGRRCALNRNEYAKKQEYINGRECNILESEFKKTTFVMDQQIQFKILKD